MKQRTLTMMIAALALLACQEDNTRLLFHAGAGQRSSLDEAIKVYCDEHPKLEVDLAYKGSGYLLADIQATEKGDLYMPGEEFYLEQAVERGWIQDYRRHDDVVAYFVTVILVPKGNPADIHRIEDFAKPGVRVALGDPQANAIGVWHEKLFKKAGIFEAVKKNAVMNAQCIPEIGNAIKLGAVDGSIVWAATAVLYLEDAEIIPLKPDYQALIPLPVGVLRFSRHAKEARELKAFLLSPEGKHIFHKHAYTIEPEAVDSDLRWLVKAAAVAKNPPTPIRPETVGHLVEEVQRQRRP